MTPRWWAAWTARASVSTRAAATAGRTGRPVRSWARLPPGTYSSTTYGWPACSPVSNTWTMFGCWSRATATASDRNRASASGVARAVVRIVFTATIRLNCVSHAR